jgi:hypothetical protein
MFTFVHDGEMIPWLQQMGLTVIADLLIYQGAKILFYVCSSPKSQITPD